MVSCKKEKKKYCNNTIGNNGWRLRISTKYHQHFTSVAQHCSNYDFYFSSSCSPQGTPYVLVLDNHLLPLSALLPSDLERSPLLRSSLMSVCHRVPSVGRFFACVLAFQHKCFTSTLQSTDWPLEKKSLNDLGILELVGSVKSCTIA